MFVDEINTQKELKNVLDSVFFNIDIWPEVILNDPLNRGTPITRAMLKKPKPKKMIKKAHDIKFVPYKVLYERKL